MANHQNSLCPFGSVDLPRRQYHALPVSHAAIAFFATLTPLPVSALQPNLGQNQAVNRGVVILKAEPNSINNNRQPPCPLPLSKSDLQIDLLKANRDRFDRDLAGKLNKAKQSVTLELLTPFPAEEEAPPILSRWLDAVRSSGGEVTTSQYCAKTRGLISFFRKLLGRKANDRLDAAKPFDAVVYVDGSDQTVTQIQFRRRPAQ